MTARVSKLLKSRASLTSFRACFLPGRAKELSALRNTVRRLALQEKKEKNLMTARVSMLLKSRASLTSFRACFLPGWAKELSTPRNTVRRLALQEKKEKKLDDSSCLDVVEIARVPDILPRLFPSWSV